MSNADKVRTRIAEAKEAGETPEMVVAWAIETLGMKKQLAGVYVKNNWDKKPKAPKTPEEPKPEKAPKEKKVRAEKTPKLSKTKTPSAPLNNMTDVRNYLISLGKEVNDHFDGGKVVCDLGEISMAFGDFFVRVPGEVDEEGRQISRVMSPAHLRRYILGDNSKIGKLEIL